MPDPQPPGRPHVPRVGGVAPDFSLPNAGRDLIRLDRLVDVRPVVVLFYRGYW